MKQKTQEDTSNTSTAKYSPRQLGNYYLIRRLGTGGFADVFLGEHIYLKTRVALKVLQTHVQSQDMQQFLTEARTISLLHHPHIIRVFEFGVDGTTPFLVMEYAPNGTLRQECTSSYDHLVCEADRLCPSIRSCTWRDSPRCQARKYAPGKRKGGCVE